MLFNIRDALIHSRTVLEKKGFVTTGVLTFAEGDIFEVEIAEHEVFALGEQVKVTIYSPVQLFNYTTTIVAKSHGAIVLIVPPDIRTKFGEKRTYPRVDLELISRVGAVRLDGSAVERAPDFCTITNISEGGVGIRLVSAPAIPFQAEVDLAIELDFKLFCSVQIVRAEENEETETVTYGAEFVRINSKAQQALRAFILVKQLEKYYKSKNVGNSGGAR